LEADSVLEAGFWDFYGRWEIPTPDDASNSTPGAHGRLAFSRRHLIPQNLQVLFEAGILWVLPKRSPEPAIGGWQIAGSAVTRCIHSSEHALSLRIRVLSRSQ
jgi:hypothetical protein